MRRHGSTSAVLEGSSLAAGVPDLLGQLGTPTPLQRSSNGQHCTIRPMKKPLLPGCKGCGNAFVEAAVAGPPWFLGERFSALDLYLASMTFWRRPRSRPSRKGPRQPQTAPLLEGDGAPD